MARQPSEIEREIEQQRERVGEKLVKLRARLQRDAGEAQAARKRQSRRLSTQAWRGGAFLAGALAVVTTLRIGYSAWRRGRRNSGRDASLEEGWEAHAASETARCQMDGPDESRR
jgi:hypothetical protein